MVFAPLLEDPFLVIEVLLDLGKYHCFQNITTWFTWIGDANSDAQQDGAEVSISSFGETDDSLEGKVYARIKGN